jgi:hypothetical protein
MWLQEEDEPAIVLAAQHHAQRTEFAESWSSGAMQRVLAGYANGSCDAGADRRSRDLLRTDGESDGVAHVWNVDANWRKNRRNNGSSYGVDLNRNYPFLWGQCGASTLAERKQLPRSSTCE